MDQTQPDDLAATPTRLAISEDRGAHVIRFPSGEVDGTAVRELYEQATQLTNTPNAHLLIDLTGVKMVGSAAMGMMITVKKKCLHSGAQLHIVIPTEYVMHAFEAMNLHLILAVFRRYEEAIENFR